MSLPPIPPEGDKIQATQLERPAQASPLTALGAFALLMKGAPQLVPQAAQIRQQRSEQGTQVDQAQASLDIEARAAETERLQKDYENRLREFKIIEDQKQLKIENARQKVLDGLQKERVEIAKKSVELQEERDKATGARDIKADERFEKIAQAEMRRNLQNTYTAFINDGRAQNAAVEAAIQNKMAEPAFALLLKSKDPQIRANAQDQLKQMRRSILNETEIGRRAVAQMAETPGIAGDLDRFGLTLEEVTQGHLQRPTIDTLGMNPREQEATAVISSAMRKITNDPTSLSGTERQELAKAFDTIAEADGGELMNRWVETLAVHWERTEGLSRDLGEELIIEWIARSAKADVIEQEVPGVLSRLIAPFKADAIIQRIQKKLDAERAKASPDSKRIQQLEAKIRRRGGTPSPTRGPILSPEDREKPLLSEGLQKRRSGR